MDNEPLNIEDTSIYSRPMSASGQDKKVGQDELGNPVYQDVRGRTYIVKPNEQPFERPEGGFVRAAGRAIQNIPPVADWDFEAMGPAMARGAKAVGEVLWNVIDTPRATLTGERQPTFGDAWDVGGFAGSGGLVGASRGMIPEGALGVNVPYYRSRQAPKAQTPEAEGPINWEEYGLTPPADEPGWANITHRDLENYRLSDEMPDEWLGAHGMREDFWEALEFGDLSPFEPTGNAAFLEQATNRVLQQAPDDIGRASGAIAQFRSPVREVAEEITIPSKGLKGSEFIKHLQGNHTVRNSEVNAMDMQIDPSRRYTRKELMEIVDQHAFTTEALGAGPKHSTMQRQPVLDPAVEYEEIMINASRQEGQPMFQPKHGQTHYDDNTIGHARVSVRQPDPEGPAGPDNRPYLLVEEMQSDLTQHGYRAPRRPISDSDFTYLQKIHPDLGNVPIKELRSLARELGNNFDARIIMNLMLKHFPDRFDSNYNIVPEARDQWNSLYDSLLKERLNNPRTFKQEDVLPRGSPPVTSTTDSTRAIVQSIMAYADQQGVSEIVFPPLERIAAERFTPGTPGYAKAIKPGSGFHRTYVTSLNKVLKELEKELGPNNVSVSQRDINYGDTEYILEPSSFNRRVTQNEAETDLVEIAYWRYLMEEESLTPTPGVRAQMHNRYGDNWLQANSVEELLDLNQIGTRVPLPSQGISLQILNPEYDYSRPRFHKGGLVTRTKQALGEL